MTGAEGGATPRDVAVVGAGMLGLATAWFLRQRGLEVTVYERDTVAAGSSWGNAGWLTPAITTPLPEPAVLRYGFRTALLPSSPIYVPPRADPTLWRFLAGFATHCTTRRWSRAMAALVPLNASSLAAFDVLAEAGAVPAPREAVAFVGCFRTEAERSPLVAELEHIRSHGQRLDYVLLTGAEVRALQPVLSHEVDSGLRLVGQRFIHPPEFLASLAASAVRSGVLLRERTGVDTLVDGAGSVTVVGSDGERHRHDAAVVATGAWLGALARSHGVRRVVQAGRGYSFSVPAPDSLTSPLYFPAQRLACTPLRSESGTRLRVAGMMEFRSPDEPLDQRRIRAVVEAVRPLLHGMDLDDRQDEWVGARPCTTDGLPLVGRTASPRVFVAGGHAMSGIGLGPLTGRLLAQGVATGVMPPELAPLDPTR